MFFLVTMFFVMVSFIGVSAADDNSDTLVMAWAVNVGPLNPHMYSPNQMFAQAMVYDSLVGFDGKEPVPSLAESWTISPDGRIYTFKLRKDVKFSDGTPFNSKAVAQNFEAVIHDDFEIHSWLGLVLLTDKWETPDDYTFVLYLKEPYNVTLAELSQARPLRILSPTGFIPGQAGTSKGIKSPIGSGPWVLKEIKLGEYDLFERNENYWGEKPPYKNLLFKVLPDPNSRIMALETDEVDLLLSAGSLMGAGNFSVESFVRLSRDPAYVTVKSEPRFTNMIAFNTGRNASRELAVRKAIEHAVDKEALVKYVLLDQEKIAHTFFNPVLPYCNVGLEPYTFDRSKANALLDEAGWAKKGEYREKEGQVLSLDLHYIGSNPKQEAVASALQADLKEVGVRLVLRAEEESMFFNLQKNGNFDLIFNETWGPPYEPTSFTASMRTPSHADYQAQLGLPEKKKIDETITSILPETDEAVIAADFKYVLTTLHEEAVYLPFSYDLDLVVYKKDRLNGFEFAGTSIDFKFSHINLTK